ncbi:unnamed protein product [Effrenium voratum]|nr:unnamed protein product [Effrenium voratum]
MSRCGVFAYRCRCLGAAKAQGYFQLLTQRRVAVIHLCDLKAGFHDVELSATAAAYAGCSLATLTPSMRGYVLEAIARGFLRKLEPRSSILNPIPGDKCNGDKRAEKQAEYDWLQDGMRVQCKSAQLYWDSSNRRWQVRFRHIKPSLFDELVPVLYIPGRLYFLRQDSQSGLSFAGRAIARGHAKTITAPTGLKDISDAASHIKLKIQELLNCRLLGMEDICDQLVGQAFDLHQRLKVTIELEAFRKHPLVQGRYNSPSTRGIAIQNMVQEVDSLLYPGATHVESTTYNSPFDWRRSGLRVECKHSRIAWTRNSWRSKILAFDRCM